MLGVITPLSCCLEERSGVRIARYDFSEPQAGKDICDRRIASIKSHIRRFVNERNDVETATSMKVAIESHGGVMGCYASVRKVQTTSQTMHKHTMTGAQSLNNFSYKGGGLRAWQAYHIGPEKFYTLAMLTRLGTPQCEEEEDEDRVAFACPEEGASKCTSHLLLYRGISTWGIT